MKDFIDTLLISGYGRHCESCKRVPNRRKREKYHAYKLPSKIRKRLDNVNEKRVKTIFREKSDEANIIPMKKLGIHENYFLSYGGMNTELANKLNKYRRQISLDKHVSEAGIFNNKELNLIVSNQPSSIDDLKKIGVAHYTIENYGEAIINIVNNN